MMEMALKAEPRPVPQAASGLDRERVIGLYRTMVLSRHLDDREILLKRQQKIYFQISGAGHEAITAAAGDLLRPGSDWAYPYYRDRALCLRMGVTPLEMLLEAVGAAEDPASGGRQMPSHWGHATYNIVSSSSPTGTQFLQALGCAEAGRYLNRTPAVDAWLKNNPAPLAVQHAKDEVVLVSSGEGATSEGEFWEALNGACREQLPVLFLIEDNGYAISVPSEVQGSGAALSDVVERFPHLAVLRCDGCDLFDSYATMEQALRHCREGRGPALVHAQVVRPYSHSLSDDERLYRPESEREDEARRDPIQRLRQQMLAQEWSSEAELAALEAGVDEEILAASEQALSARLPSVESIYDNVYSPAIDITSERFGAVAAATEGKPQTMVDLINACMHEEMARPADPGIRRGCGRLHARGKSGEGEGQGGRFQGDRGPAAGIRQRAGVQFASGRSLDRGPGDRHGDAGLEAVAGDPVLRLHLACDDAVAQRDGGSAMEVKRNVRLAGGAAG